MLLRSVMSESTSERSPMSGPSIMPTDAEMRALRAAIGELRKPASLVKAQERLRDARIRRQAIAEKRQARIAELQDPECSTNDPGPYLREMDRQFAAASMERERPRHRPGRPRRRINFD